MENNRQCVICNEGDTAGSLSEVRQKGLNGLIESSRLRKDGKHTIFAALHVAFIHPDCRKNYTRKRSIYFDLKREETEASTSGPCHGTKRKNSFNFEKCCLFCSEVIDEAFYAHQQTLRKENRRTVCKVLKDTSAKIYEEKAIQRNDELGRQVLDRLSLTSNLVMSKAIYHLDCRVSFMWVAKSNKLRRPLSSDVVSAMQTVFNYLRESEECQFSSKQLLSVIENAKQTAPAWKTVENKLKEEFGNDIIVTHLNRKDPVVCFSNIGHQLISKNWYEDRLLDENSEKMRIVKKAAEIIRSDIKLKYCDVTSYPASTQFLDDVDSCLPESLTTLLENIILKDKKKPEIYKKKCITIGHSIMSAVRPVSFISTIQLGIASYLYKKVGSKTIIDVLSKVGLCASYSDVRALESSVLQAPQYEIKPHTFCQFIFDNTDFNVNTIDGLHTFHSMGGVQCVTPISAIVNNSDRITKTTTLRKTDQLKKSGVQELQIFQDKTEAGLKSLILQDLSKEVAEVIKWQNNILMPTNRDTLWMVGKYFNIPDIPGWRGFHERITGHKSVQKTKVLFLPFINAPPSDYDTIYTSLQMAAHNAKDIQLQTSIVTFDQPLYLKARDIVACSGQDSELKDVVIRLGGFHTLMSFLGCIGFIMAGSGLRQILSIIYAPNSVDKLLAGHAYARAVRAHLLVQLALSKIILKTLAITYEEREIVCSLLQHFRESPPKTEEISEHPVVAQLAKKLEHHLLHFDNNGPTAKLWLQYFNMVTILKLFIESEREGNWTNHLLAVRHMLPYFHASGHFSYAKSCHIYLQDMVNLKNLMNDREFEQFTEGAKFTTKRTGKFWSGTWSDQIIEQTLNREFKIIAGPIGRGSLTDSSLTAFTTTMPILHNICEAVENFSERYFSTSEQHVEARESRIQRDDEDVAKLVQWFQIHDPFQNNDSIVSLSTGVCGDPSSINCFRAREIGEQLVEEMQNKEMKDIRMKRSNRVSSLASINCTVKIQNKQIIVDPFMIFQRMTIAKQSETDLEEFLKYELAPYPLSLFCETGMRKNKKSALMNVFTQFGNNLPDGDKKFIIDGGFLLHRVLWNVNTTYKNICITYLNYVKKNYGNNCIVVFDGYNDTSNSTKASEQHRRSATKTCPDIAFEEHMIATIAQDSFLRNKNNKARLIFHLKKLFEMEGIAVQQSTCDADTLIIETSISAAASHPTVVVGEDTDLLVLLVALAPSDRNIYFLKPGRGKSEKQIFSSQQIQETNNIQNSILLAHAFGGCDTTSAIFQKGKLKVLSFLQNEKLKLVIDVFMSANSTVMDVQEAGELLFLHLYGSKNPATENLNALRYHVYRRTALRKTSRLAGLPPTCNAAAQHSFRTYCQVQAWLGNTINPQCWGWQSIDGYLQSVTMTEPPAPQELLKLVACSCKTNCTASCGCKKAGLKCSDLCLNCVETGCFNLYQIPARSDSDNDEDIQNENDEETN